MYRSFPTHVTAFAGASMLFALAMASSALAADGLPAILRALQRSDAYVSPKVIKAGHATSSDAAKLQSQADDAARRGLPEISPLSRAEDRVEVVADDREAGKGQRCDHQSCTRPDESA